MLTKNKGTVGGTVMYTFFGCRRLSFGVFSETLVTLELNQDTVRGRTAWDTFLTAGDPISVFFRLLWRLLRLNILACGHTGCRGYEKDIKRDAKWDAVPPLSAAQNSSC